MMENDARYTLIGVFTFGVLAAVFGFFLWITANDTTAQPKLYDVVFTGSVTGLAKGGDVLFNGIKVGQVKTLAISPADPNKVVARVEVDGSAPVKTDTKALLEFQGLTGIGYIQLSGGAPDSPILVPAQGFDVAAINADKSDFQNILEGVKETIATATVAMGRLDSFLADNQQAVTATLANVEKFSGALATNSDGIQTFLGSLSEAGSEIGPLAQELTLLSADVRKVVGALNAEDIEKAVKDVTKFTDAVASNSENVDSFFEQTTALATNLEQVSEGLKGTLATIDKAALAINPVQIQAAMDGLESFMTVVGSNTGAIDAAIQSISHIATNLDAVSAALPPDKIETAVTNLTQLTDTIAANNDNIDTFFVQTAAVATNLKDVSGGLQTTLQTIEKASAAIDPERVRSSMESIDNLIASVAGNAENVDAIVLNAREITEKLNAAATRVDGLIVKVDTMVSGDTGEGMMAEFGETAKSIRVLAEQLDKRTAEISSGLTKFTGSGLREYQALATEGQNTLRRLDRVIGDLERNPQRLIFGGKNVREYKR
jgi:phospholipid/cholesterol/gamma-HCH transport system substrate-binding protein